MKIIKDLPEMKGTFLKPESVLSSDWSVLKNEKDVILVLKNGPASAAMAFKVWPQVKTNISLIIYAGGTLGRGDATAYAEKSVYRDPYGMESLLNSGIPVVFCTTEEASRRGMTVSELAESFALNPELTELISCGVHTEIQSASPAFGKLVSDHLADHKFEKKNAYIFR